MGRIGKNVLIDIVISIFFVVFFGFVKKINFTKEDYDKQKREEERRKKYNPDDIFKKRKK